MKIKDVLTPTLVITSVPSYFYLVAFWYEKGLCDKFGIPSYLIAIKLTSVFISSIYTIALGITFLFVLGIVFPFYTSASNKSAKSKANGLALSVTILIFLKVAGLPWLDILFLIGLLVLIYVYQKSKSLKFFKQIESKLNFSSTNFLSYLNDRFEEHIGQEFRTVLSVLITIPVISYFAGNSLVEFKIPRTMSVKSNILLLRKYDDIFIGCYIDSNSKIIPDSIAILKIDNNYLNLKTSKLVNLDTMISK